MKVEVLGGGPAGLYLALLLKRQDPAAEVTVHERNRAHDTFGWGVVFSEGTLGNFAAADPPTHARLEAAFRRWDAIATYHRGACVLSHGHGFAAIGRRELLLILQERCHELGVALRFQHEVADPAELGPADLVVAADGANSRTRELRSDRFRPEVALGRCAFCWLGTDRPLEAFTFVFVESEHGLFQAHAYPYAARRGTWIVECREEVWRRAGLDRAGEAESVAFCERLFAPWLQGHRLLANRSSWRFFPTVRCQSWVDGNLVLLGDAAHTAHFSIGSGTKLAMEDAIALARALGGRREVAAALHAYEAERRPEILRQQRAAETSREWFESSARYLGQHRLQFTFNLMTRSKRITYDNLRRRDPALVEAVDAWFRDHQGAPPPAGGRVPPPIFTPFHARGLTLRNRVVVAPMRQYSAVGGVPGDWHLVHLGSRAVGGAGLVLAEMTGVCPEGRITHGCTGLWGPEHAAAWRRIVDFVHARTGAAVGIQLAHAGRKGSVRHPWEGEDVPLTAADGAWTTLAPSAIPYHPHWPAPRAMDRDDMDRVRDAFVDATRLAVEAGFDWLELQMAHGYLLSSFLSPLVNRRGDAYGGALANRLRYPLEVFAAVRAAWPSPRPMSVCVSASDWMADGSGTTPAETVEVARELHAAGCDVVHVTSAGNVPDSPVDRGRMHHVPFADRIRHEAGVPVMVVGGLHGADHANTVIAAGRADLAVMARPHLRDAYLTLHAAERYGVPDPPWPPQYPLARGAPRPDPDAPADANEP